MINIPATRTEVVKTIVEYRMKANIANAVEEYVKTQWSERSGQCLYSTLTEYLDSRGLVDCHVSVSDRGRRADGRKEWRITVIASGCDIIFHLTTLNPERVEPDVEGMMQVHRLWGPHASYLELVLPTLEARAEQFNAALAALADISRMALPPGSSAPVYPLATCLHYYDLSDAVRPF